MGNDIDHLNILVEKCLRDLGNNTGTTVVSSEHRVMITGTLLNNNRNIRQKVAKILFNQFHFTALNIQNSLLLGLQYSGRSTGIIINIEDDATSIAAIYDGSIIHNQELPYGQSTAVKKVAQVLYEDGILGEEILGEQGYKDCYNIYISKCFVISDPKYFTKFKINPIITPFRLSNGQEIELGKVIYQAAEVLVHPEVAGLEEESIANVILKFIRTSPEHMRTFFASNIVLMGHGAKVEGLQERLISELLLYSTRIYDFRIRKSIAYEFGAWPGAQVFASSPIYEQSMIVIEDYNSIGDTLIN
jgi:centractin